MPLSVRQRIVHHLRDTLTGPVASEVLVMRTEEPAQTSHDWGTGPLAVIHAVSDEPVESRSGTIGLETRRMVLAVEAWTDGNGFDELADAVEELLANLQRAVMVDPGRGRNALTTSVGGVTFLLIVGAPGEQRIGGFSAELVVSYRYPVGQPDAA